MTVAAEGPSSHSVYGIFRAPGNACLYTPSEVLAIYRLVVGKKIMISAGGGQFQPPGTSFDAAGVLSDEPSHEGRLPSPLSDKSGDLIDDFV